MLVLYLALADRHHGLRSLRLFEVCPMVEQSYRFVRRTKRKSSTFLRALLLIDREARRVVFNPQRATGGLGGRRIAASRQSKWRKERGRIPVDRETGENAALCGECGSVSLHNCWAAAHDRCHPLACQPTSLQSPLVTIFCLVYIPESTGRILYERSCERSRHPFWPVWMGVRVPSLLLELADREIL